MMLPSRSPHRSRQRTLTAALVLVGLLPAAAPAHAQTRWTLDPQTSLAWWQVSPHLNHLWATTCPGDPSWRPGENRSSGWYLNPQLKPPKIGYANVEDTVHVPLYPRRTIRALCVEAVRGEVVVADTVHWRGARGTVQVQGDALVTGEAMRDVMMHRLMQTVQYPELTFSLDSLVGLTRQADTLVGTAVGTLTVRDVELATAAQVKTFPVAGGMRVLAKWRVPATKLLELTPSLHYVGLGVNTRIWKDFFMGADLVFRSAATTAN